MTTRNLESAAQDILDHLGTLDPQWARRIEAVQSERHLSALQVVMAFCAYVLDRSAHMRIPARPEFMPNATVHPELPFSDFDAEGTEVPPPVRARR